MEIKKLNPEAYKDKEFTVRYTTEGYYDILREDLTFRLVYHKFEEPREASFDACFLDDWLDDPDGYGLFSDGRLKGYAEGFLEEWNNRYRINNLVIFDPEDRGHGLGSTLMATMLQRAEEKGARMVVLETQTLNERAIAFYRKQGFQIIGFDLYNYTNRDPERHEVRLEMGLVLPRDKKSEPEVVRPT